jgi:sec-independent protein translocase protein TatC
MNPPRNPKPYPPQQPLLAHLIELRDRLLRSVVVVVGVFLCLAPFARDIYALLAQPLLDKMPKGATMIATEVTSPFIAPFKLTFLVAIAFSLPFLIYQAWSFVAPGLYRRERRIIFPLMVSGTALFFTGMAFAYYLVFPTVFGFMVATAPQGVAVMTDISKYLDFVLAMFLAFGFAFEVPVVTVAAVYAGFVTPEKLAASRRYVIVGCFVVGAIFTPPDVLSQFMLAIPMWLLFEIGLFVSRFVVRSKENAAEAEEQ